MELLQGPVRSFTMFTKVVHGLGSLRELPAELKALGAKRPLIVADPGLTQAGLVARVAAVLTAGGIASGVFDQIGHDADSEAIDKAAAQVRAGDHDAVIAMGGGSPLVAGKAAALVATNGGSVVDYVGDDVLFPKAPVAIIAIPTTAGSGSEVSSHCPFFDMRKRKKVAIRSQMLYPAVAILDANLLATLPPRQAALSGVDALTHAIEAYLTDFATPITDALALAAMRDFLRYLPEAVWTGSLAAREKCLLASTIANMACGNAKLGLVHDLAKPVFTFFPVPYGEAIGTLLVPVMEFNRPAMTERFAEMGAAIGVGRDGMGPDALADAFLAHLTRVVESIGFVHFDPAVVPAARIPGMARYAFSNKGGFEWGPEDEAAPPPRGTVKTKNRRKATYDDVVRIYQRACTG